MEEACRLAAEDAHAPQLLARASGIRVPRGIWGYSNPAALARHLQTPEYNEKILLDMKAHGMTTFTAGGWLQSLDQIDGPHAQRLAVNVETAAKTGLAPPGDYGYIEGNAATGEDQRC